MSSLEVSEYNSSEYYYYDHYGNGTQDVDIYAFYMAPQFVFQSLLCVSIIVGNLCVLWAVRLADSGRQTRMNFFILHLAVADLLVGLVVCSTDLITKVTIEWYGGNVLCKLVQFLQGTVSYSSTFILVSLSLDRFDAVARPMNFSRSGVQARILIGCAWGASLFFALPFLFLYQEEDKGGRTQCWLHLSAIWHWQLFFSMVAIVIFFIPTIIIALCYTAIIYIIWSKGRARNFNSKDQSGSGSSSRQTRLTISDSRHITANSIIPQAKIRTIKMTLIIVIVFILCWSPYFIFNLVYLFGNIPANVKLATFLHAAAPLNSAANPVIYGIFSTRICRNLRRLTMNPCLRKTICRCTEADDGSFRGKFRAKNYPRYYNHLQNHHTGSSHTDPTLVTMDACRRHTVSSLHGTRAIPLVVSSNVVIGGSSATFNSCSTAIGAHARLHSNVTDEVANSNSSCQSLTAPWRADNERAIEGDCPKRGDDFLPRQRTSLGKTDDVSTVRQSPKRSRVEVTVYHVGKMASPRKQGAPGTEHTSLPEEQYIEVDNGIDDDSTSAQTKLTDGFKNIDDATSTLPSLTDGFRNIDDTTSTLPSLTDGFRNIDDTTSALPSLTDGFRNIDDTTSALPSLTDGFRNIDDTTSTPPSLTEGFRNIDDTTSTLPSLTDGFRNIDDSNAATSQLPDGVDSVADPTSTAACLAECQGFPDDGGDATMMGVVEASGGLGGEVGRGVDRSRTLLMTRDDRAEGDDDDDDGDDEGGGDEGDEDAAFKSVASRRPSGLPVVRKTLTPNESRILCHVTGGRLPVPSLSK